MTHPKSSKIERTCRVCSTVFFVYPSKLECGGGIYCSRQCLATAKKSRRTQRACETCGTVFDLTQSAVKKDAGRYCSKACEGLARKGIRRKPWVEKSCRTCDKRFEVYPARAATAHFCSRPCAEKGSRQDVAQRYWSRVDQCGSPDACWPWTGRRNERGYGQIWVDGRNVVVTHLALAFDGRALPDGTICCHTCDHPWCVNPRHLFVGSHADNAADRERKQRSNPQRGEIRWNATLTDDLVREVLDRGHQPKANQTQIARDLGLRREAVKAVLAGQSWRHISGMAQARDPLPLKDRCFTILDPDKVRAIRRRHATGETMADLAIAFGVKRGTIWAVIRHKIWKDVA